MAKNQTDTPAANVHQLAHGTPPRAELLNVDLPPTDPPRAHTFLFDYSAHYDTLSHHGERTAIGE